MQKLCTKRLLNNKTATACKKLFLKNDILIEDHQKAFRKILLFAIYYLTQSDDVIESDF